MTHQDIIRHLCLKYPPETIHEITTENIISAIVRRMGEEALELSQEDLELATDEVRAAIEHYERDIIDILDIGVDAFFVLKNL